MLLDIWSVLGGIGLAAVAFVVVILVCVVVLRLLAAILPSYAERDAARLAASEEPASVADPEPASEALGADTAEPGTHRAGADDQSGR
jgi:hypothetical protein